MIFAKEKEGLCDITQASRPSQISGVHTITSPQNMWFVLWVLGNTLVHTGMKWLYSCVQVRWTLWCQGTYTGDVNPLDDFKMKFLCDYKFNIAEFISRIIFTLLLCLYSLTWTKQNKPESHKDARKGGPFFWEWNLGYV